MAICGGGKMAQFSGALGDGCNHCIAVGNGFVTGRFNAAGELLRGLDRALFHEAILAWGLQDKNFTTECTEFRTERTCPIGQFLRRNSVADPAIFPGALTYYLVQEKL